MVRARRELIRILGEKPSRELVAALKAQGIERAALWTWRAGERRPEALQRDALERLLGIKASGWRTPKERRWLASLTPIHTPKAD